MHTPTAMLDRAAELARIESAIDAGARGGGGLVYVEESFNYSGDCDKP